MDTTIYVITHRQEGTLWDARAYVEFEDAAKMLREINSLKPHKDTWQLERLVLFGKNNETYPNNV